MMLRPPFAGRGGSEEIGKNFNAERQDHPTSASFHAYTTYSGSRIRAKDFAYC